MVAGTPGSADSDAAGPASSGGSTPVSGADSGDSPRRSFLATTAMAGGLVAGYGTFGYAAVRFLYPSGDDQWGWQYLAPLNEIGVGGSFTYTAPSGATVVVTRKSGGDTAGDFIALSNVCPHLGCQVNWESNHDRYFCPCHNGAFDAEGHPIAGPPLKGQQQLVRFELRVAGPLLYIKAPLRSVRQYDPPGVADRSGGGSPSPTHDDPGRA